MIITTLCYLLATFGAPTSADPAPASFTDGPAVSGAGIGFPHGFSIHASPWLEAQLGARVALDYRGFDRRNTRDRTVSVDELEVRATGRLLDGWILNAVADLRGVDARNGFAEAWAGYDSPSGWRARVGLLPTTIGIEHSLQRARLPFIDRAFPASLDGKTDYGGILEGEWRNGFLSAALWGQVGEGFDREGERRGDPQLGIRVMSYPLRTQPWVGGAFLNVGWSYSPDFDGHLDIRHPYRPKLLDLPRLDGDQAEFLSLGYGWDAGRLRFIHEWVRGGIRDVKAPAGGTVDLDDQLTAWQATVSYRLFGPDYDSRLYHQLERVERRLDPGEDAILEAAVRYSNADIDRRLFDQGFTSYTESSQEFRVLTAAVNFYPKPYLRLSAELSRTIADQYPQVFDSHGRDTSFIIRGQVDF